MNLQEKFRSEIEARDRMRDSLAEQSRDPELEQEALAAMTEFITQAGEIPPELLKTLIREENEGDQCKNPHRHQFQGYRTTWNNALETSWKKASNALNGLKGKCSSEAHAAAKALLLKDLDFIRSAFTQIPFGEGFPLLVGFMEMFSMQYPTADELPIKKPQDYRANWEKYGFEQLVYSRFPLTVSSHHQNVLTLVDQWLKKQLFGPTPPTSITELEAKASYLPDYAMPDINVDYLQLTSLFLQAKALGIPLYREHLCRAANPLLHAPIVARVPISDKEKEMPPHFERVQFVYSLFDPHENVRIDTIQAYFGSKGLELIQALNWDGVMNTGVPYPWNRSLASLAFNIASVCLLADQTGAPIHNQFQHQEERHLYGKPHLTLDLLKSLSSKMQTVSAEWYAVKVKIELVGIELDQLTDSDLIRLVRKYSVTFLLFTEFMIEINRKLKQKPPTVRHKILKRISEIFMQYRLLSQDPFRSGVLGDTSDLFTMNVAQETISGHSILIPLTEPNREIQWAFLALSPATYLDQIKATPIRIVWTWQRANEEVEIQQARKLDFFDFCFSACDVTHMSPEQLVELSKEYNTSELFCLFFHCVNRQLAGENHHTRIRKLAALASSYFRRQTQGSRQGEPGSKFTTENLLEMYELFQTYDEIENSDGIDFFALVGRESPELIRGGVLTFIQQILGMSHGLRAFHLYQRMNVPRSNGLNRARMKILPTHQNSVRAILRLAENLGIYVPNLDQEFPGDELIPWAQTVVHHYLSDMLAEHGGVVDEDVKTAIRYVAKSGCLSPEEVQQWCGYLPESEARALGYSPLSAQQASEFITELKQMKSTRKNKK